MTYRDRVKLQKENKTLKILLAIALALGIVLFMRYMDDHDKMQHIMYSEAHDCAWTFYADGRELCH